MSNELGRIRRDVAELAERLQRFAEHHDPCERCDPPHDNKPRLRPHTIEGWWQVWSGGICIALLAPEDVAPVLVAGREALAAAAPKRRKATQYGSKEGRGTP